MPNERNECREILEKTKNTNMTLFKNTKKK